MAMIGIDLGTTNSLVCVYRSGKAELIPNEIGTFKTSSAVCVMPDGSVLVGAAARERLITYPKDTAASFKVWMGTERTFRLGNKQFKPEELSALVLRQLKQDAQRYLGEPVEEAVISVPAYFNDDQRCATKFAAQLAGLEVRRLINEPSAAALYHRYRSAGGDCQMMIIDFGGGTLDVSIVECFENIIEITAIAGDNHLGGDDIDRAIVACFCDTNGLTAERLEPSVLASLYRKAEAAKIALSAADSAEINIRQGETSFRLTLTRELLRKLCDPLFQRVRTVISQAMKNRERSGRIDDVILVGGSSQLSVLGDFLEELFGRRPTVAAGPDEIVALGAGLCAGIRERAEELQDLVMTDVCPFSLGVATYNGPRDQNPHMAFLIQRSSILPASHSENFYTLHDNQDALRFRIYQGEGYFASENLKLGELEIRVPPDLAGKQYAAVTFTYDIDGILHVSARSSGGDYRDKLILNPHVHLTEAEHAQALERMKQIRLSAQGTQKEQLLLEKALRLYQQTFGSRREFAAGLIEYIRTGMENDSRIARERMCREVQEQLAELESEAEHDPVEWNFGAEDGSEESGPDE